jgi:putative component of membrane protein insertase Oxa1/YidC/SpoIIIJ protein YidD
MMRLLKIPVVLLMQIQFSNAQSVATVNVADLLVAHNIEVAAAHLPKARSMMLVQNSALAKWNPLGYISAGMMFLYQRVLSEQIQANCMYQITCSEYAKKQIEKKGLLLGMLDGCNQLTNCFMGVQYQYPKYMLSSEGKIRNDFHHAE